MILFYSLIKQKVFQIYIVAIHQHLSLDFNCCWRSFSIVRASTPLAGHQTHTAVLWRRVLPGAHNGHVCVCHLHKAQNSPLLCPVACGWARTPESIVPSTCGVVPRTSVFLLRSSVCDVPSKALGRVKVWWLWILASSGLGPLHQFQVRLGCHPRRDSDGGTESGVSFLPWG